MYISKIIYHTFLQVIHMIKQILNFIYLSKKSKFSFTSPYKANNKIKFETKEILSKNYSQILKQIKNHPTIKNLLEIDRENFKTFEFLFQFISENDLKNCYDNLGPISLSYFSNK
ncbi:hypothetical protein DDB_G0286029 [Dictyostelium discoideum AX4]|uniref:Uncharacterized protein n=1 Tax=Dictyostelium discoideum TaxID=44689 RepID=Q54MD3_DICDI|nr:hypothetical protein DDB_G0286029 [Dictyostelium discoideum AX4]EAL64393.1 hypothetical protein DDB_G0286029 [Dictyostelium discoideum AX4]|eukprot:XP_637901.1 hypothetical protein DDB_G0286029 [Dictyostelium discoideum AX4]